MDQQQGLATNIPPLFPGDNYAYWSVRMKWHLMSLRCKQVFWKRLQSTRWPTYRQRWTRPIWGQCKSPECDLEWVSKFSVCKSHAMKDNQTCLGKIKNCLWRSIQIQTIQTSDIQRTVWNSKNQKRKKIL